MVIVKADSATNASTAVASSLSITDPGRIPTMSSNCAAKCTSTAWGCEAASRVTDIHHTTILLRWVREAGLLLPDAPSLNLRASAPTRPTSSMGKATPKLKYWSHRRAELYVGTDAPLLVGSKAWFEWLELPESKSFSFDSSGSSLASDFTARRETRNKGNYWYGYKLINCRLRNTYIGLSSDLTFSHLLQVGKQLSAYED